MCRSLRSTSIASMIADLLDLVRGLVDALNGLSPISVIAVALVFMALDCSLLVGLLVPADAVVLVAAGLLPTWGDRIALTVAVVVGSLAGELLGYLLGRAAGSRIRRGWAGRKLGQERWRKAETYLDGRGARSLVVVRFIAVVHSLAPIVAGSVGMPLRRFLAWSTVGSTVWAVTFVSIGATAGAAFGDSAIFVPVFMLSLLSLVASVVSARSRRTTRVDSGEPQDEEAIALREERLAA